MENDDTLWISVKDKLPKDQDVVIVRLNGKVDQFLVCRFYDNLFTMNGHLRNMFVLSLWSKFPKFYALSQTFFEHFSFKKAQVTHWKYINFVTF